MNATAEIYYKGRTHAEHCAWLESLEGDEYRIVHMPPGHLFNIAMASFVKRGLLTVEMTTGERMRFLDGLADMIHGPVTADAIAAIQPIDDIGQEMLREIMKLPVERQTQAFAEADVFRLLAQLNPSLLRALEVCSQHERRH